MYSTPYFVIYVDLGGSGPPSSFILISTLPIECRATLTDVYLGLNTEASA